MTELVDLLAEAMNKARYASHITPVSVVTAIPEAQREALLLGLAWAEAAAALPQGGYLDLAMWPDLPVEQRYEAEAAPVQEGEWGLHSGGYARSAPTASAALQALTVALRER